MIKATKRMKPNNNKQQEQQRARAVAVHAQPKPCPTCGSHLRSDYYGTRKTPIDGKDSEGRIYYSILYRYCKCLQCEQVRCEFEYQYSACNELE